MAEEVILPGLEKILIDNQFSPSPHGLIEKLKEIDSPEILKNTKLISIENGTLSFSFDTLANSRLFLLELAAAGREKEYFVPTITKELFEEKILRDGYRIDGYASYSESIVGEEVHADIFARQLKDYGQKDSERFVSLIKEVVAKTMPHLSEGISDFHF